MTVVKELPNAEKILDALSPVVLQRQRKGSSCCSSAERYAKQQLTCWQREKVPQEAAMKTSHNIVGCVRVAQTVNECIGKTKYGSSRCGAAVGSPKTDSKGGRHTGTRDEVLWKNCASKSEKLLQ